MDQQPAEALKETDNLMDMENDKLDLESAIRKEEPALVGKPVPPHQEEDIEDDDERDDAFSSHEGEDAEDGTSRENGQKKKRKREAKFEDKHPTD